VWNRGLEDKIARLCQTPFIGASFGSQAAAQQREDAMGERDLLRSRVVHLTEAVRTNYAALVTLREQAATLRAGKEEAEGRAEMLRAQQEVGGTSNNDTIPCDRSSIDINMNIH
jgi:outer membrane protein TolC